jgi:5-methylthioadenosine/S-adenosylhomocysteine deaminase
MKILLNNIRAITLSEPVVLESAFIAIEDGVISHVSDNAEALNESDFDSVIDGQNRLVSPGFVNTHTHSPMVLLRGYADDLPLKRWLEEEIWPLESKMTGEDAYWGSMLGIAEMIRGGTTGFSDMYYFMNDIFRAVDESGMRARLAESIFAPEAGAITDQMFETTREFLKWTTEKNHPRISTAVGPHAVYSVYEEAWAEVIQLSNEFGIPIHTHVLETRGESENAQRDWGHSPFERLKSLGVLENQLLAAHCVFASDKDLEIIKQHDVKVLHNPTSNLKLASGFAPIQKMLDLGINVSVGTDGASSNNNVDMLEEIRLAAMLQKGILEDATAFPTLDALRAGTEQGARALGWDDVGTIEVGKRADLVIFDIDKPHWKPDYDLVSNLVYSASSADVETVIIDGRFVMKDREILTFDEEKAKHFANEFKIRHRRI